MENGARDTTEEWLLPRRGLLTVADLEARVEEATAIARASEAAAISIGAAAIESAEQAKRAANLALKASEAAARGAAAAPSRNGGGGHGPHEDDHLVRFSRRADRLSARFARLQRR